MGQSDDTAFPMSLAARHTDVIFDRLHRANAAVALRHPGVSGDRQPVHTVYGGAHLFKTDTATKIGRLALRSLQEHAPDFATFAKAVGLPGAEALPETQAEIASLQSQLETDAEGVKLLLEPAWRAWTVYRRVLDKLGREPVEDFRIDFEDGYGSRADAEEDGHAVQAAVELAKAMAGRALPPFIGIRIKPLSEELARRGIRTLDLFISTLLARTGSVLPDNFVVTLPKITHPEQVSVLADLLGLLETQHALAPGSIKLELMVETTQSIIDDTGSIALPRLLAQAEGRCVGIHLGPYDYTASCDITAAHQHLMHPACDFARHIMQVATAGTGIRIADGPTNVMPIGPHRGEALSTEQRLENQAVVHRAWRLHVAHVQHALSQGYYQGWDLHPAQLPARYAAVFNFFLEGLEPASLRLANFIEKAAQATLIGDVFDDAATGQGLLNYFLRAITCGALTESDALVTGLTLAEIRQRSFVAILANRRAQ